VAESSTAPSQTVGVNRINDMLVLISLSEGSRFSQR
jgi:hypothetical protein